MATKKGRGIGRATKLAVAQLMGYILEKRIIKIHSQRALHRMIEIAKFPHTIAYKRTRNSFTGREINDPLYWKGPIYAAGQYIRVTAYMVDKFFDVEYAKGKYFYTLNHTKCQANLQELMAILAS